MPNVGWLRDGALLALIGVSLTVCRGDSVGEAEVPAGLNTRAVATMLPAGASVVVSGYDVEGFWSRVQASRLYKDLKAIQGVREAFAPLAESQREFEAETGLPLNEETLMTLFGQKFDLGFYGPLPEDHADLLFLAEVEDEGRGRTILETLEKRVTAEKGATFRGIDVAGTPVRVAKSREGDDVLFYAFRDKRLTMATTEARLRSAIDLAAERGEVRAMTTVEEYVDALEKLPDAAIAIYIDQEAVRQAAVRAMADTTAGAPPASPQRERLRAATSALETYRLASSVAVGVYWTESGIRADVYSRLPEGPRPPLAAMLTGSPEPVRSLAYQPVTTLLYGSINTLDAKTIYDALYDYAVDATRIQMEVADTPDSLRADSLVAAGLQNFQQETGIDIQRDIVSWVGREAALGIAGVDKSGFFPLPEVSLVIATQDRQQSSAFLSRMETELTEMARVRASVPLTWQVEEYQGQQIRYAPTPLGEGLSVAYTIDDQFVLIGSNRSLVKRMLDARAGRAQALPQNPDFATMTEFYPQQANAIGFINIEQILTQVQDLMATYGQMGGSAMAADTTSTTHQVLRALKNAPRLGFYSEADDEGVFGHVLLEVR
ncbi:MAG: DUF3352 domain-containing protein [Gemmatimonadota bacterium]